MWCVGGECVCGVWVGSVCVECGWGVCVWSVGGECVCGVWVVCVWCVVRYIII